MSRSPNTSQVGVLLYNNFKAVVKGDTFFGGVSSGSCHITSLKAHLKSGRFEISLGVFTKKWKLYCRHEILQTKIEFHQHYKEEII